MRKALLLIPATLALLGCKDQQARKEIADLKAQVSGLSWQLSELRMATNSSKEIPALLSPVDRGYDFSSDSNGQIFAVSLEDVSDFPGGVKYHLGITNLYAVSLRNVELKVTAGEQTQNQTIQQEILPGRRLVTPVVFMIDKANLPKTLSVQVQSKGMRFGRQF